MGKVVLGVLLGAVLGVFDGLSALVSAGDDPAIQNGIVGIVIGSTMKGMMVGVAAGFLARRNQSLWVGVIFGTLFSLLLAFGVAAMQGKYYLEIMLPGGVLGAIVGYATQTLGKSPESTRSKLT